MKKTPALLSLLLALLMLTPALYACADTPPAEETNPTEATTPAVPDGTTAAPEATTELVINALNILGARDMGKATITIYTNAYDGMWSSDLFYPENDGDILGSAVYQRNANVSENFNVEILEKAHGSRTFASSLKNIVSSNDTEVCQAICTTLADAADDLTKGNIRNLSNVQNINLSGQWWNQANNASWSIGGRQYFANGDITTTDDMATRAIFFNKDIMADNNIEAPYQMVKDGKWTFDRFFEMVSAAAVDVGGNGMNKNEDTFGLTAQNTVGFMLLMAAGEPLVRKDSTDIPYIATEKSPERIIEVASYLTDKISGNIAVFTGGDDDELGNFRQNRALFMAEVMSHVKSLRSDYDVNFGLLPMPKYNEDQDTYYQYSEGFCAVVVAIPSIIRDELLDQASFVLEAMAIESVETVTPAFYDLCLKGRYSTDYESTEMLDIITRDVLTDYGDIYAWGGIKSTVKNAILNGKSLASELKTTNKVAQKEMERFLDELNKLTF